MKPGYLKLSKKELERKAKKAWELLSPCHLCPRKCGADRAHDKKTGFCKTGKLVKVYSTHPHFGEESCLVGIGGSGTIFFSSCNLSCVYCQNFEISQLRFGEEVNFDDLASMMIYLQERGGHNINFVSPTIWVPQILKSLLVARERGLQLPLVYNTGGYDAVPTLKILDGIVDIYMPDIKYSDNRIALKYSQVPNYWDIVRKGVKEMHRQAGDLVIDSQGLAIRGLLIRHLVLPEGIADTKKVMRFIASLSKDSYVNIMDQYYPTNKARFYPEINRRIRSEEFEEAIKIARKEGLYRFDKL